MSWLKRFIAYYKDNPEGYWFKRKLYGWGWMPVKWQGWLVVAVSVVVIFLGIYIGEADDAPGVILLGIVLALVIIFFFGYRKGEKPKWMWGPPEEFANNKKKEGASLEELARSYYTLIDEGRLEEMYNLFSEDIVYTRNDLVFNGKEEFIDFYRHKRRLSGAHDLRTVSIQGDTVSVLGTFTGTEDKKAVSFPFEDRLIFNEKLKISKRHTVY